MFEDMFRAFGANCAAVHGVAEIHRIIFQRDFQKPAQRRHRIALLLGALGGNRDDDEIVNEAFGVAKAVKRIGHFAISEPTAGARAPPADSPLFMTARPRPKLVFARLSL